MSSQVVSSWTPVIIKGGVYQKTISITDENGDPVPALVSAQIDVTPVGDTPFSWTQANGKFTNVSAGVYSLDLTAVDTAAFAWTVGKYVLNIVDNAGDANPCLIEGKIWAKDC